jgi:transposase
MKYPSLDLRRRMVEAYESGLCKSYREVAEMFGVGEATVSRNLRRKRETGDVTYKARGHRPRRVNLEWVAKHAEKHPDARLEDRAEAWEQEAGLRVTPQAIWYALKKIGWSFKKRHQWRANAIATSTD